MRKNLFLLLCAALILGSCTPSEPNLKKENYLKIVNSTVDMTAAKAEKTLTRKGFVPVDTSVRSEGLEALLCNQSYEFSSKDSSLVLHVGLVIKNDSVKQFVLTGEMEGQAHAKDVQKLYSDWSNYAYNTILAEISLWSASCFDEDNYGDFAKIYIDGPWASMIKSVLEMYHMTGEMDEETYQVMKAAFERKRGDYEAEMSSLTFLQKECDIVETFIHGTGTPDLASLMTGNMSSLKGKIGAMTAKMKDDANSPHWTLMFVYMNEQDMSKIMENLPF